MTTSPPAPNTEHGTPSSTIAAVLTPVGQGGIAILHVAGPRAFELLAQVFRPKSGVAPRPDASRLHYGHVVDGGEVVDEVLVRLVPASEDGGNEPTVEVNCHGGLVAVRRVLECFTQRGAEAVDGAAFVERHARSAIEAEALQALREASTTLGVEVLLDQLDGALERALSSLPWDQPSAAESLRNLLAAERFGRALWQPPRVAIVGPVNAGKSSLFNALAREDRMIVSPVPGTTRDAVSALVAIGGLPVVLTDTAGEREPASEIETEAIARARAAAAEADLALLILDASPAAIPDSRFHIPDSNRQSAMGNRQCLVVLNKRDLGLAPWAQALAEKGAIAASALTGAGLPELCRAMVERMVGEVGAGLVPAPLGAATSAAPAAGRPVVFSARQARLLAAALEALEAGKPDEARGHVEEAIGARLRRGLD